MFARRPPRAGRALKFYASMRVDIRRIQAIKEGDKVVGVAARAAKVVKNKSRRRRSAKRNSNIVYGEGISREGDLIESWALKGRARKSGTWISSAASAWGQGRENARIFLKENKDIRDSWKNTLRKKLEIPVPGNSNAAAPGANGHAAASASSDKSPIKTSAAVAARTRPKRAPLARRNSPLRKMALADRRRAKSFKAKGLQAEASNLTGGGSGS